MAEATEKKAPAKKAAAKAAPKPKAEPKAKAPKAPKAPRQPKVVAETDRGSRKTRQGIVVSTKMEKTVVVKIERRTQHPLYGKVVIRSTKFKAHDIIGCDEGDRVEIMETRPLSKDKRWRVTQIIEKVK